MKPEEQTQPEERYLTIKELSYELQRRGLPSSRSYILKLKKAGAPFFLNRALLSEILRFMRGS